MEVFPADEFTDTQIKSMITELVTSGLLEEYEVLGVRYWQVTGWKHQKIDQPTFKHPLPSGSVPSTPDKRRAPAVATPNVRRTHAEGTPPDVDLDVERKGGESTSPIFSNLTPIEAARMFLCHEDVNIPASEFELKDTRAGIEAIMGQEKLICKAALDWAIGQYRKCVAAGKKVGPGWMRRAGYNDPKEKRIAPMVSAVEEKRRQMREAGD
jgi:hypothetical protein